MSWATLGLNGNWLFFQEVYWKKGIAPSKFLFMCAYDYVALYLENLSLYNDTVTFFYNYPVFYYFAMLFFFTILLCYFFLTYLGFYGVFSLIFVALVLFWVSLLLYIDKIFVDQRIYVVDLGKWILINNNFRLNFYFLFDTVSYSFVLLTTTIAVFVFAYAFSYFRYEPLVERFILFLASFVVSMLFLVSSGNTVMMFLGWELIGLTSFLLINF